MLLILSFAEVCSLMLLQNKSSTSNNHFFPKYLLYWHREGSKKPFLKIFITLNNHYIMNESRNPFADTVAHFSDKRLNSIVSSPNSYAPKLVAAANYEVKIRNLEAIPVAEAEESKPVDHLKIVRQNLGLGVDIDNCEYYLLSQGLTKEEALNVLDEAVRLGPLKINKATHSGKEKEKSIPIWLILLTIFSVIRLIMRLTD